MSTVAERDQRPRHRRPDPTGPVPPQIKFSPEGFSIDHPDPELGDRLMAGALGAADRDAMHGILRQLARASSKGRKPDAVNLAFMISMVRSIRPRDSVEAMLVAQMVSVHVMAMRCAHHLANAEDIARQDSAARALGKLARVSRPRSTRSAATATMASLLSPCRTCRSGRRQGHRRQRHAACERDRRGETKGRADEEAPAKPRAHPGPRVWRQNRKRRRERSRPPYRRDAGKPALRRQNPVRRIMPLAGGARQTAMPHARRGAELRRA